MTGISWMLQEAGDCPGEDYIVYDDHEGEEEEGSGESMEYEYTYDAQSDKEQNVTDSNSKQYLVASNTACYILFLGTHYPMNNA